MPITLDSFLNRLIFNDSSIQQNSVGPTMFLQESRPNGTNSATTLTALAWTPRQLELVSNTIPSASFNAATRIITLPAGNYFVIAHARTSTWQVQGGSAANTLRLRRTSDSVTIATGVSARTIDGDQGTFGWTNTHLVTTFGGSGSYILEHWNAAGANIGGGEAISSGELEIYASMTITRY